MTNEYQDILDCLKRKDQMITKKSIEPENSSVCTSSNEAA